MGTRYNCLSEAVLRCTHDLCLSKNITIICLKIIIFTAVKNHSILHGHVIVMHLNRFGGYSMVTEG